MMNIAVMGFGVVGSGTVELIDRNRDILLQKTGLKEIEILRILDLRTFPDSPYADRITDKFSDIENDTAIDLVVETMGGLHPAFEFVSALLKKGKSVVTSNKELVASKGFELISLAKENGASFLFEASVGGGIPLLRPIYRDLGANRLAEVVGILNGTTNFILTQMIENNMDFDSALKMAQSLGYAEKDPSADIDGLDASRKICILASLCFGHHVYPDQTTADGIRNISLVDVAYAKSINRVIKLLSAAGKKGDGRVWSYTAPCLIPQESQLAVVNDVFNAVIVRGDAIGETMFYGRGAGKFPTAAAVISDIIDIAINGKPCFSWEESDRSLILPERELKASFYVRGAVSNYIQKQLISKTLDAEIILGRPEAKNDELAILTKPIALSVLKKRAKEIDFHPLCILRMTNY